MSIKWAPRSRVLEAPASALSAVITLRNAKPGGGDFAFTINRDAAPAGYTKDYTSGQQALVGTWPLEGRFYSMPNGQGSVVGSVDATVNIDEKGDGIGDFVTEGKIAAVEIAAGQTVGVGQTVDLIITARDSQGAAIVLAPGAEKLQIVSGSGLQITSTHQVKGVAPGESTLTATVDGITSPPQTVEVVYLPVVTVTPESTVMQINGSLHLLSTVTNSPDTGTVWSVQEGAAGGTVDANGNYVAPSTPGTYHVIAASHLNTSQTAVATITVNSTPAVGATGIFVSDTSNDRIVGLGVINGTAWAAIGTRGSGQFQFNNPEGIFVDDSGAIYVADRGNHRIVRMDDLTGRNWQTFGTLGTGVGQFQDPRDVFADSAGRIYVADYSNNRLVRIDAIDGSGWATQNFSAPRAVVVDSQNRIYGSTEPSSRIYRFEDFGGTFVFRDVATSGQFAVASNGMIFLAGAGSSLYQYDSIEGTQQNGLSEIGSPPFRFTLVSSVATPADGRIYVTDSARIVRIDDISRTNWRSFGASGSGIGQFSNPSDLFVR